jgi:PncC family amidohydrolase
MTEDIRGRIQELEALCRLRRHSVGLAESCTGGLLSSWICAEPGVSSFFLGSVVSYARSVKRDILKVPEPLLMTHGEVSVPVALAMAKGARQALGCSWAVSLTGVAGPSGGRPDRPVGFVCFAAVGPGFERAIHHQFSAERGREDIQRQAALFAFDFLLNAIR